MRVHRDPRMRKNKPICHAGTLPRKPPTTAAAKRMSETTGRWPSASSASTRDLASRGGRRSIPGERLPPTCAKRGGSFFNLRFQFRQDWLQSADDERQSNKRECHKNTDLGKCNFDAVRLQILPHPTVLGINCRESDASDRSRQR